MSVIRKKTPGRRVKKKLKRTPRKCAEPKPLAKVPVSPVPECMPPARYLEEPNLDLRKVLHWVCLDAARMSATEQVKFLGWVQQILAPRLAALASSPTNTPQGDRNTRALMRFVAQLGTAVVQAERDRLEFRARLAEAWIQQNIAKIEWAPRETDGALTTDQMSGIVTVIKAILEQDGLLRRPGSEEEDTGHPRR